MSDLHQARDMIQPFLDILAANVVGAVKQVLADDERVYSVKLHTPNEPNTLSVTITYQYE